MIQINMDMPESCTDCPFRLVEESRCFIDRHKLDFKTDSDSVSSGCKLKSVGVAKSGIKLGDKYITEVDKIFADDDGNTFYMLKGVYNTVFDEDDLRSLTKIRPEEETVSKGLYDQYKWERDIAVSQLHELGYSLGEAIREEDKKPRRGEYDE